MGSDALPVLWQVLRQPATFDDLSQSQIAALFSQARHTQLLGRIARDWSERASYEALPLNIRRHFDAALVVAQANSRSLQWEIKQLSLALKRAPHPVTLLKGAAYHVRQLPNATGRLCGDIDLLVPKNALGLTEELLKWHGWGATHHSSYDERYYRRWMHEIPPLKHQKRQSVVDLHHALVPPTSRYRITRLETPARDAQADLRAVHDDSGFYTLTDVDMVLHSIVHLMTEGEWDKGLRDLVDLRDLIEHFGACQPHFIQQLEARALELKVDRLLYYTLRLLQCTIHPQLDWQASESTLPVPPAGPRRVMMALLYKAVHPRHSSSRPRGYGVATSLLYLRAHYLRMPLHLLLPHLTVKAFHKDSQPA